MIRRLRNAIDRRRARRRLRAHVARLERLRTLYGLVVYDESLGTPTYDAGGYVLNGQLGIAGDTGNGLAGRSTFTNSTGVGNGAQTAVTSPLVGTGNGPANGQVVTNFLKVYVGAAIRWLPVMT